MQNDPRTELEMAQYGDIVEFGGNGLLPKQTGVVEEINWKYTLGNSMGPTKCLKIKSEHNGATFEVPESACKIIQREEHMCRKVEQDLLHFGYGKAKPGDVITPNIGAHVGEECIVVSHWQTPYLAKDPSNVIWAYIKGDSDTNIMWLEHGDYEIITVKVGDTIKVIDKETGWYGKQCVVKEVDESGIRVRNEAGTMGRLYDGEYEVVCSANQTPSVTNEVCKDCHGTGKIELFTSIAICNCRK